MHKLRILAIGLLLLGTAGRCARAEEPNVLTGLRLYEACKGGSGPDSSYCRGVLLGFVTGLSVVVKGNAWRWSCTGSDASLQIGYVAWAEKNAALLDQEARDALSQFVTAGGFCNPVRWQGTGAKGAPSKNRMK